MKINGKKIGLSTQVFVAMLLGGIIGLLVGAPMKNLGFIGEIWLNCVKMIIVPLVLITVVTGIVSQKDIKSLGKMSIKIIIYFIITTAIASITGLLVSKILQPGLRANFVGLSSKEVSGGMSMTVSDFFLGLFSTNMFQTFASGNILQTLIIAVFIGAAVLRLKSGESKEKITSALNKLSELVFSIVGIIMNFSPIGIFFLMANSFATYGASIFTSMATLLGTYYAAILVHILITLSALLWVSARISPFRFVKDSAGLWTYTIATCSSAASIPVSMSVAKEKFGVPERISGFTIPLGSQMNYNGSVILYAVVISFITQLIGQPLDFGTMLKVIVLSGILSTGGGGIPGSGIVKLLVVVEAFGLPTEMVGIIAAFYRLFDMGITTTNSMGNLAGTIFMSKLEEKKVKTV